MKCRLQRNCAKEEYQQIIIMQIWIHMPVKKFICGNGHILAKLVTFGLCETSCLFWLEGLSCLVFEKLIFFWIYNTCCYPWIFFVGFVWCFPVSRNLILRLHCFLFLFLLPGTWMDPIHGSLAVFITSDQLSFLIHLFPKMRCTYMQKFLVHLYLLLFLTPVLWHSWSNNKLQVIVGTVCMIGLY